MTKPFTRQALLKTIDALLQAYPPAILDPSESEGSNTMVSATEQTGPGALSAGSEEDELSIEYRQSLPDDAAKLSELWLAADWPAVQKLLHKIKGTSACFGFHEISTQANVLAQQLKNELPAEQELKVLLQTLADTSL